MNIDWQSWKTRPEGVTEWRAFTEAGQPNRSVAKLQRRGDTYTLTVRDQRNDYMFYKPMLLEGVHEFSEATAVAAVLIAGAQT